MLAESNWLVARVQKWAIIIQYVFFLYINWSFRISAAHDVGYLGQLERLKDVPRLALSVTSFPAGSPRTQKWK